MRPAGSSGLDPIGGISQIRVLDVGIAFDANWQDEVNRSDPTRLCAVVIGCRSLGILFSLTLLSDFSEIR